MSRPTVMTDETIAKLEEAFAWGCTDVEACLWANIAPATLYFYQEKNPGFVERKEALKEKPVLLARQSVVKQLRRDGKLAMDYLQRKKKDEFSIRNEVTGKDGTELFKVVVEDTYGNRPKFRTDNTVSEVDAVAADSSSTSSPLQDT